MVIGVPSLRQRIGRSAVGSIIVAIVLTTAAGAHAAPLAVTLRNSVTLPSSSATDQFGVGFTIAGMSGLARRTGSEYLAVMDNSSRLVRLSITNNPDASIGSVTILGGLTLPQSHDFEGIAFTGTLRDSVLLSDEDTPAIREFSLETPAMALMQTLPLPAVYANRRANFGLESLTWRCPPAAAAGLAGGALFTANEEALSSDGAISSQAAGTDVRVQRFASSSFLFSPNLQLAHLTEPWHGSSITSARSGVSDMLALPDGRVILLERALAFNLMGFFQARLYELDFTAGGGATDVSALPSLVGQTFTRIGKRLLWSGDVANLEGLALGPKLPNGSYAMLGVVDDGDPISNNTLVSWELSGIVTPCPGDFDWSGATNPDDLFAFLDAWFTENGSIGQELPADADANGRVDVDDLFRFLDDWFSVCP